MPRTPHQPLLGLGLRAGERSPSCTPRALGKQPTDPGSIGFFSARLLKRQRSGVLTPGGRARRAAAGRARVPSPTPSAQETPTQRAGGRMATNSTARPTSQRNAKPRVSLCCLWGTCGRSPGLLWCCFFFFSLEENRSCSGSQLRDKGWCYVKATLLISITSYKVRVTSKQKAFENNFFSLF